MSHIHLCWELGGGLGHAGRLKMLAQALLARGHRVTMSLRDLMHTHAVLADLDVPKLQAPVWLHKAEGLPPSASLAEIAFHCGYLQHPRCAAW
jgi:nucleoside-diphosphate-sugar epimerase